MPPYTICGEGENRVLVVQGNRSHSFRFWHKEGKELVQFRRSGARIIGATVGKVLVYKLPNAHQFHKEFMAHNARALWLGMQSDPDRLVDNMLEYVEVI